MQLYGEDTRDRMTIQRGSDNDRYSMRGIRQQESRMLGEKSIFSIQKRIGRVGHE